MSERKTVNVTAAELESAIESLKNEGFRVVMRTKTEDFLSDEITYELIAEKVEVPSRAGRIVE